MMTVPHSIKRARDLFEALERAHPEPVRGLPGSLTVLVNSEGAELAVERWFDLHGHNEGPRRYVVARPTERGGGSYVVELDGPSFLTSGWTGHIEASGQIAIGEPTIIRRARERTEELTGASIPAPVFIGGLLLAGYLVFR